MKFTNIHKSDACNVRSIKFKLDAAVSGLCFEQMLSMKEHLTKTEKLFLEKFHLHVKTHELMLKSNLPNTNVARGSVYASTCKIG